MPPRPPRDPEDEVDPARRRRPSRRIIVGGALAAGGLAAVGGALLWPKPRPPPPSRRPHVDGIVWQPDNATVGISGDWHDLGAYNLLVQWTAVDGVAFVADAGMPTVPVLPDWSRIAREPWARNVILGLAGRFSEAEARANVADLAAQSLRLAFLPTPLNVTGRYFPVEVDPTWRQAPDLATLLAPLPRPLWISVYDSANVGAATLADWLTGWLPADIGVFFQDGVGVYARTPTVARQYADALADRLGRARLRVIVEAFRPAEGGGFRAAIADEIAPQITALSGYPLYLFDGPHYLDGPLVEAIGIRLSRPAGQPPRDP